MRIPRWRARGKACHHPRGWTPSDRQWPWATRPSIAANAAASWTVALVAGRWQHQPAPAERGPPASRNAVAYFHLTSDRAGMLSHYILALETPSPRETAGLWIETG